MKLYPPCSIINYFDYYSTPISMKILFLFTFIQLIISSISEDSPLESPDQKKLIEQFQASLSLITFQQNLRAFPYLARNIKATVLSELMQENCPSLLEEANATTRLIILNNKIYVQQTDFRRDRAASIVSRFNQIVNQTQIPDLYVLIDTGDKYLFVSKDMEKKKICESVPVFLPNKNCSLGSYDRNKFLFPDGYMMAADWPRRLKEIRTESDKIKFEDKKPVALYRGIGTGPHYNNANYQQKSDIFRYFHRGAYVILSFEHPQLIDARFTSPTNVLQIAVKKIIGEDKEIRSRYLNVTEHLQYKYLLSADGFGAAWRRVPWFLASNSLVFKPQSRYIQWFFDKMIPDKNFVSLKSDLSDLVPKLQWFKKNDAKSLEIIKNANILVDEHLTEQAMINFMTNVLLKYAEIQKLNISEEQKKEIIQKKKKIDEVLRPERVRELTQIDKLIDERWKEAKQFISVAAVFNKFPHLKESIKVQNMLRVLSSEYINKHFLKILFLDHKVYCWSSPELESKSKVLSNFLGELRRQYELPDMFFLVMLDDQRTNVKYSPGLQKLIKDLPIFMLNKNISSAFEASKFLLPNLVFIEDFEQKILQYRQDSLKKEWKEKISKAFFQGKVDQKKLMLNNNSDPYKHFHQAGFAFLSYERPQLIEAKLIVPNNQSADPAVKKLIQQVGFDNIALKEFNNDSQFNYKYQLSADQQMQSIRVPSILSSHAVLVRPLSRVEWFDDKIVPGTHYIALDEELSNIFNKVKQMKNNDTRALQIAKEAHCMTSQLFSKEKVKKYVADSLRQYSRIQRFKLSASSISLIKKGEDLPVVIKQEQRLKRLAITPQEQKHEQIKIEPRKDLQVGILVSFGIAFLVVMGWMGKKLLMNHKVNYRMITQISEQAVSESETSQQK